jgi:glutamine cyclotransferase
MRSQFLAALSSLVPPSSPPTVGYSLLATYPHDTSAFTQGLHYEPRTRTLLESTGLYGESSVRRVNIESGRVLHRSDLPRHHFGEGLTVVRDAVVVQLLWREGLCLLHAADTLAFQRTAPLPRGMREGWGLTADGKGALYASDGSNQLYILDEDTLEVRRTVPVHVAGRCASGDRARDLSLPHRCSANVRWSILHSSSPLRNINDLQWVRGEIWANLWREDRLACIDPDSGAVRSFVDLSPLLSPAERQFLGVEECLNGIAYDAGNDELFVTGKCWPKLFKLRVPAM